MANEPESERSTSGVKSYDAPERPGNFFGTSAGRIASVVIALAAIALLLAWIF